ncbi:MAG: hypothetical protein NZ521_04225 [Flammeovirgaceae bacterium]|nr:hypothetical protein [Flammeovirgaceae bacterium]MDW8287412.1 proton-conducting transporter membrane subunit [Flammeovirgaceae bacterium]
MEINENYFILSFVCLPLIGFWAVLGMSSRRELLISQTTTWILAINLLLMLLFLGLWFWSGMPIYNIKELTLYQSEEYLFLIDFFLDKVGVLYLLIGGFITFLIVRYSRYYMHLEKGYKRFFATILFFYFSYNFTVLSGNFETLFLGWEFLGISSFLLIAFYRERYLPVRNAVKVFSIYRLGDIGLLLAMWASHHLWHENITFNKLLNAELVHDLLSSHSLEGLFIAVCLLVAASAKSAQFPFSSWVARAVEGPTPSSAIFYGSLSIHLGAFLLIRTMPFWQEQSLARWIIGIVGMLTAIIGYFTSRVQPTIKTQIAYASIAQIGLMFIEIAMGWENLALFHFVGNAFLRTYQFLVSPSVVAYLIREQFYHFRPYSHLPRKFWLGKSFAYGWYLLSLKEFLLDDFVSKVVFKPFKIIGNKLNFITHRNVLFYFLTAYLIGCLLYFIQSYLERWFEQILPVIFATIALLFIMKAFSERVYPQLAWLLVILGHFWIALAVSHNEYFSWKEVVWYLSGVVVSGAVGLFCLERLKKREKQYFALYRYFGHSYEYPYLSIVFLLAALGLMGFPITTTFIGEDLIFNHVHEHQYILAFLLSSCYVIEGIALIRIYARLFLGNHAKPYHETPLQSS